MTLQELYTEATYRGKQGMLLRGDCIEWLKKIPDQSIKLLLCDPPYGIDYQSQYRKDKTKWHPKILNDKKPFVEFIPELPRIIAPTGGV